MSLRGMTASTLALGAQLRARVRSRGTRRHRAANGLRFATLLCATSALAFAATPAEAQYFGRNKVQYEKFDWRIFETPHFSVYFYPAESLATLDMARSAERWYERLSGIMQFTFQNRPLIFYANHPDFQQTNVIEDMLSESTGGVTESLQERVIMPHTSAYGETDHVLGHELVHVFQYGLAGTMEGGFRNLNGIPLWMIEGMAEYLSVGQNDAHTAMWLRDALLRDDIPSLRQLTTDPRYFPYRYGQAFWAYVGGRFGDMAVPQVYRHALALGPELALRRVTGRPVDTLSMEWHEQIRRDYGPMLEGRSAPKEVGTVVVGRSDREGDQNVAPVVSPDGRHVAFFSSRELFGFSLFLADAETGRTIRQLTSITSDQHFDALSFLQSSAAFSPDGQRLAFVVFADGDNELNVMNVSSGRIERRIQVSGVGAISDPAWSPDGRSLAFSGNSGGISDLYIFDFESGQTRAITTGRNAEIQPAWSPDGSTIAFVTDRSELTNFDLLTFGSMRVALFDVATGNVTLMPAVPGAKVINPQFSPDGQSLYVISDRDGFSDIYRLSIPDQQLYRVTRVATGVSGITALSQAMSVARETGRIVFSVFDEAGYSIHRLEAEEAIGVPEGPQVAEEAARARLLPPIDPLQPSIVNRYLADVREGLPATTEFPVKPFRPRYTLEYLGMPSVGVSFGGPFGSGAQGGVLGIWGDQLGDQRVGGVAQVNGTLKDIGAQAFYQNRKRRWNWGAAGGRTPYVALFGQVTSDQIDPGDGGPPVAVDNFDRIILRQYFDEANAFVQYPFSPTRRFELGGGFQRISYDVEIDRLVVIGNSIVDQQRLSGDAPPAINLGMASAAVVGDNSYFGYTGPIAGQRYRLEATSALGTLNFTTAMVDYRKYFFPRPVTFAIRAMHYGRYGSDAEDNRLGVLYLGSPYLIRGYDYSSFNISECTPTADGRCPEYDRLNGSRVGVLNLEMRIPLFGPQPLSIINFPYMPIDIVPFVDAGVAWTSSDSPDWKFDRDALTRVPVVSSGVSARINLFGYFVFETYYVVPFQRPNKSGYFSFQLQPAW